MSQKKIIFFIAIGLLICLMGGWFFLLKNQATTQSTLPKNLKIWIKDGITEDYSSLIEGFRSYAPEYAKVNIIFEKKTTDPVLYRTLLLSTMADGNAPDIIMIGAWEDVVLESKIQAIPDTILDISDFDRRYDDLFLPLVFSSGSDNDMQNYIKWIPLGFETLWMFYNNHIFWMFQKLGMISIYSTMKE
jgi:ABC-type glycerol-3-phosphate transport system substrate-binding protein